MTEATFNSAITRTSETNYKVRSFSASTAQWSIEVSVRDSVDSETRVVAFNGPDAAHAGATVVAFLTALDTVRGGESGTVLARANYRILGFLVDQNYVASVTLVP